MRVWKGICGSVIIISLEIHQEGSRWFTQAEGEQGDAAADLLIMQLHTSSFMEWTGTHQRVNALHRLPSEKFILRCRGNCTDTVGLVCLPLHPSSSSSSSSSSSTHVHAHPYSSLSPSSIHPFALNYALWLFVSVFFQKLPGETRVEEPIACSQQIKEACVFFFFFFFLWRVCRR